MLLKSARKKKVLEMPTYNEMVEAAITNLKDRTGSSRQAIAKYIADNYDITAKYEVHMKQALKRLLTQNVIVQTRGTGASGSFMMNKASKKAPGSKKLKKASEDETEVSDDPAQESTRANRKKRVAAKVAAKVYFAEDDASAEEESGNKRKAGKRAAKATKKSGARPNEDTASDEDFEEKKKGKGKTAAKPKKGRKTGKGVPKRMKKDEVDASDEEMEDEVDAKPKGGRKTGKRVPKRMKIDEVDATASDEEMEGEGKSKVAAKVAAKPKGGKGKGVAKSTKRGGRGAPQASEDAIGDGEVGEGKSVAAAKPKRGKGKRVAKKGDVDASENTGDDEEMPHQVAESVKSDDANSTEDVGEEEESSGKTAEGEDGRGVAKGNGEYSGEETVSEEEGEIRPVARPKGGKGKGVAKKGGTPTVEDDREVWDETGEIKTATNPKGGKVKAVKKGGESPLDSGEDTMSDGEVRDEGNARQKGKAGAAKKTTKRSVKESSRPAAKRTKK